MKTLLPIHHAPLTATTRLAQQLSLCVLLFSAVTARAQTISWQEDWESPAAQDCWVADFGYWEIGVPTYGPLTNSQGWRAHQGTNCAATVLTGNYTDNRESRLSSCPIQVPAANQNPRLRFWHWWNFSYGDYGQVQISTNNGATWQPLSEVYGDVGSGFNYWSGDRWTQAWLDLTPYAGKTVVLGLYFYSRDAAGGDDTAPGWYVDEMVIESGDLPVAISQEGFEDAAAFDRWTADFGVWEIGVPMFGPPTNALGRRAHGGTNCLATLLDRNYHDQTWSRMSSAPLVVPAANLNPGLRFWHWWNFSYGDYGQVQISTNNGATWQALSGKYGEDNSGFNYWSSGKWTRGWLDLTPYAGQTVRLGFYFYARDAVGGDDTASGWYVDDLLIKTGPLPQFVTTEDFEEPEAQDRWTADRGVWEIGVPTSEPGSAHGGTNCLATLLDRNYYDQTWSRMSSAAFVVPAANLNPRLRFWHWWSFSYGDSGQVQISTNNGTTWQALSENYGEAGTGFNYHSSAKWTRGWLDLTAYSGMTVRLGFYFYARDAAGGDDTNPGWYVDDLSLETGPLPQFAAVEDFEEPQAQDRWTADNGVWEIGVPTSGPPTNAVGQRTHGGTNCLATLLDRKYYDNTWSRMSSATFVVPSANLNPRLRFWHWWSFSYGDSGQVQISTNNGATWQALSENYGEAGSGFNYHSSDRWTRAWLDLTPFAGLTVRLGFYFYARDAAGGDDTNPGWYVDDLLIETGPLAEMTTPDSFEDAAASDRWTADHGVWEIGVPTSGPGAAHSGSNCLATLLDRNYYDNSWSRIYSQAFVVPPKETNPRLRLWHWWSFSSGDYGKVQISADDGANWADLATYTTSSSWTQPQLSLTSYAGKKVRLGFYFYARDAVGGDDTAPGWFIDEVRLVHDFAVVLMDSPVVRTQSSGCVSLGIAGSAPVSNLSFTLQAPTGHLGNLLLNMTGCWSGGITPLSDSQWSVSLTNNCTTVAMGVAGVGSICFTAVSPQSAFVPLTITDLVGPPAPRYAFGSRAVTIAEQPLLEAWLGANKERMLTLYGIAGKFYGIYYATNLPPASWAPGWEVSVPSILVTNFPVIGSVSNAPALFLRAYQEEAGSCLCDTRP